MNLFPCHAVGFFQCEWNDCSDNFTLVPSDLAIVLRDSQAPDGHDAVAFANPKNQFAALNDTTSTTTLVVEGSNKAAETAASPSGTQSVSSHTASATGAAADGSKSSSTNLPLALGLAIPLGVLLMAALGAVFYYRRRATKSSASRHSNHSPNGEISSSDWSNSPKPKTGWQNEGPHDSSGSAMLASHVMSEMPDRGPLPELKGPGNSAHELSTSGRNSMPMRNY
ncbi:MAG: hypothetical protein OHK93_000074 [Ramalina farinacea]|uniref:Uncharacterized protein n=1 Tax=Ramalina farinacea TaxID=258253 RepID=A0AA43QIJ2_9LECA|nr:hypothetical protein [Ramalina farinacea]